MARTYQKEASKGEVMVYQEILNPIADGYNQIFSTLILPKALSIDSERNILTLPYYEGQNFNNLWNESTGGSLLGLDLSVEVPRLIRDLASIDVTVVTQNVRLKKISNLIFDRAKYVSELPVGLRKFLDAGIITDDEARKAIELCSEPYASAMILNNGDFYPRNFIRTPENKIVLIDWESWNSHSPFYIIDHPENVAAVCFVSMWNNRLWQEKYVFELRKLFPMRRNDFQKAIIIKSLELADFWFQGTGRNELCENQIALFKLALTEKYMEQPWVQ